MLFVTAEAAITGPAPTADIGVISVAELQSSVMTAACWASAQTCASRKSDSGAKF